MNHETVKRCRMKRSALFVVITLLIGASVDAARPDPDAFLSTGRFAEGVAALNTHLQAEPKDDVARFGLGVIEFVQAVEQLGQKLARYEFPTRGFSELREILPPPAEEAEPLTYPRLRQIIQEWLDDVTRVDATLSKIESDQVKLPLHVGNVPLNLGGLRSQPVTLIPLLRDLRLSPPGKEADFVIAFDRADVDWLRGYCHALLGLGELGMAHHAQDLFDTIAHRIFHRVKTPHEFLLEPPRVENRSFLDMEEIADFIAAIHLMRCPVSEPKRMEAALAHFEQTLSFSRKMWRHIVAEQDDDQEWIPNPRQKSAINVGVSQEMIDQWLIAVDEVERILHGKRLVPFWRGKPTRGINVRRVFLEAKQTDVILWIQGTAATPFLETGEITDSETWQKINRAFGGQLWGFGVWFN